MPVDVEGEDLLYNLAFECESLFDQLQESFQKTRCEAITIELCAEFQQRFAIWAAHLGVFARKSQCLDTRLQNYPDLQDLVTRLLDILRRSLQQCTADTSSQREGDKIPTAALKTVDDTLARLNRLGVTIRQAGRGKFDARAKKYAAGLDLSSFASLSANAVQTLYPGAHQSLKDHLSKSMTDRYSKMLFLGSRHKILETRRELRIGLLPIHEIPIKEVKNGVVVIQQAMMSTTQAGVIFPRPPPVLSQSDLSSVNVHQIRSRLKPPDEASTKFHKTSSIQVNQGNYPRPPVTNQGSGIFTCPWCFESLGKKTLSESEWRQHIDRDLKPYICLSERCHEGHPAYPTFDKWLNHMELHDWRWHQQAYPTSSWMCTICEFNQEVYSGPQALYAHLEECHSVDFTNAQLQAISRQSKTEQSRASNDCLLCCFSVEEHEPNGETIFPKRRQGQSKQEASKSARTTLEKTNPSPHSSDLEYSDSSSDSDDTSSRQHRRQRRKDHSKAVARHIAVHLQVLMLLTLRFAAALQADDGNLDDGTKSDSVDIDEGNSDLMGTDLGKLSHIASEAEVTMKEGQDGIDAENTDGAMDLDVDVDRNTVDEDFLIPDTDFDLNFIPRQHDGLLAKNDEFLNKVIASGAYQSWRDEPAESMMTSPPPLSDAKQLVAMEERIASNEELFRQKSLDESVINKWSRQSDNELPSLPDEGAKQGGWRPFASFDEDGIFSNEFDSGGIDRFKVAQGNSDVSTFKSRDPSPKRDQPVATAVAPEPAVEQKGFQPSTQSSASEAAPDKNFQAFGTVTPTQDPLHSLPSSETNDIAAMPKAVSMTSRFASLFPQPQEEQHSGVEHPTSEPHVVPHSSPSTIAPAIEEEQQAFRQTLTKLQMRSMHPTSLAHSLFDPTTQESFVDVAKKRNPAYTETHSPRSSTAPISVISQLRDMDNLLSSHTTTFSEVSPLLSSLLGPCREALVSFQQELQMLRPISIVDPSYSSCSLLISELYTDLSLTLAWVINDISSMNFEDMKDPDYTKTFCEEILGLRRRLADFINTTSRKIQIGPFSQSEIDARLNVARFHEPGSSIYSEAHPLNISQDKGFYYQKGTRILIRPLFGAPEMSSSGMRTSGGDSYRWLALRQDEAPQFTLKIPWIDKNDVLRLPFWCELRHESASDNTVFLNKSNAPIILTAVYQTARGPALSSYHDVISPGFAKSFAPGTYRSTMRDIAFLDFHFLEERPVVADLSSSKPSTQGENSQEAAGTEDVFSPKLKRVGHVVFDEIVGANTEVKKSLPIRKSTRPLESASQPNSNQLQMPFGDSVVQQPEDEDDGWD